MIVGERIDKYYGSLRALNTVTFSIGKGEIVGFLGKNGSGKTTLMRILTGYLPADSGKAIVAGRDVAKFPFWVKRHVGYLSETPPLYLNMRVYDYLKLAAQLKDVPVKEEKAQIEKVLSECQLSHVRQKTIGDLSRGYKQRLGIAQAIINDPEILILDEPTNGLDPEQIIQVRKLIKNLEHKRTVLLSTHILSEIELTAKRIIIINEGKLLVDELLPHLLLEKNKTRKKIRLKVKGLRPLIEQTMRGVEEIQLIRFSSEENEHLLVLDVPFVYDNNHIAEMALKAKASILDLRQEELTLEEIFLRNVSHA